MVIRNKKKFFIIFLAIALIILYTFYFNFYILSKLETASKLFRSVSDNFHSKTNSKENERTYTNLHNTCIIILTHSRYQYLSKSLNSLLKLPGLSQFSLIISQDGYDRTIKTGVNELRKVLTTVFKKFYHFQKPHPSGKKQSQYIADHYKFILDKVFKKMKFSRAIILEDDMIFSKDFLNYFDQTSKILDMDHTVWCVSSWNDLGYPHLVSNNPNKLYRTQYFPGLGWMLNQDLWKELSDDFPNDMWDDWMRYPSVHKNRDCIVPEISRNKNIGVVGANMNAVSFKEKLEKTVFYRGEIFDFGDLSYLLNYQYEENFKKLVEKSTRIDLARSGIPQNLHGSGSYLQIFPRETQKFFLDFLKIPFGDLRRNHNNMIELNLMNNITLLLANSRNCPYLPESMKDKPRRDLLIYPGQQGSSCDETCNIIKKRCDQTQFEFVNDCKVLENSFGCKKCGIQYGNDIPNFVVDPSNPYYDHCLINLAFLSNCAAKHQSAKRLCPCV
eukprot:gene704-8956_t